MELQPDLEELAQTLESLEQECDPVSLPLARTRAVCIARMLLSRVEELERVSAQHRADALHCSEPRAASALRTVPSLTAKVH